MTAKLTSRFWDFNSRIFRESMRQLRTVGILGLIICCLEALLVPVGGAIVQYSGASPDYPISRELVGLVNVHPLVMLPMYTLALIMPLIAFSFLNKRRASDYYHALPVSRAALFISLFAAVMAWIAIVIVGSTVVSVATTVCFPAVYQLNFSTILPLMCSALAGSLMVVGCVTFAMSITGTTFNNLLVAALIFFCPRLLMWFVSELLCGVVNILPRTASTPLLDISYNIPIGVAFGVLFGEPNAAMVAHYREGILYTAIIGLIWFVVSLVLFRMRGSEAAEHPASTRLLQHVFRMVITFLVTLIPVALIWNCIWHPEYMEPIMIFGIGVLYLLAAIAFCVYELITTKKPKRLLKAAWTFPLVLVADVVLVVGMFIGAKAILDYRPSAEEVTSISFVKDTYNINSDYFSARASKVAITDQTVIKMVTDRLAEAAERNDSRGEIELVYNEDKFADVYQNYGNYLITFHSKGASRQRVLSFTDEEAEAIYAALANTPAYHDIYQLPPLDHRTTVRCWSLSTDKHTRELYNALREEFNALPFEQRVQLFNVPDGSDTSLHVGFDVSTAIGAQSYSFDVFVPEKQCPKTANLYLKYEYESTSGSRIDIRNAAKKRKLSTDATAEFSFYINMPDGDNRYITVVSTDNEQILTLVDTITANIVDTPPTVGGNLYHINYSWCTEEANEFGDLYYNSCSSYVVLNEQGIAALEELATVADDSIVDKVWD